MKFEWDPMSATGLDPDHSASEERFVTFGVSGRGRLSVVAHTEKMILFVSLAHAKRAKERREYMKKVNQTDRMYCVPSINAQTFRRALYAGSTQVVFASYRI